MSMNKLKLNTGKTGFLLIGNERQRSKYPSMFPIELFGVKTNPAKSAQNLRVIFDQNFTFHSHISAVCSSCFGKIQDLLLLRITFVWYFADSDFTKLQHVQNRLARILTKSPPFTRSVTLPYSLHWLTVKFRSVLKIYLLTYKTLLEKQSAYLHSRLAPSRPSCSLRSNKGITLSVPMVKTDAGAKVFHSFIPFLWNNIPLSVRSVQLQLSGSVYRRIFMTWPLPLDTSTPCSSLMLQNWISFTVEHWFGSEPDYAGDRIDYIEWYRNLIEWMIDWLIDTVVVQVYNRNTACGSSVRQNSYQLLNKCINNCIN